jgi:hypothetical protein
MKHSDFDDTDFTDLHYDNDDGLVVNRGCLTLFIAVIVLDACIVAAAVWLIL